MPTPHKSRRSVFDSGVGSLGPRNASQPMPNKTRKCRTLMCRPLRGLERDQPNEHADTEPRPRRHGRSPADDPAPHRSVSPEDCGEELHLFARDIVGPLKGDPPSRCGRCRRRRRTGLSTRVLPIATPVRCSIRGAVPMNRTRTPLLSATHRRIRRSANYRPAQR
jgi:hypothetical protein